jgi:hypothetical protein
MTIGHGLRELHQLFYSFQTFCVLLEINLNFQKNEKSIKIEAKSLLNTKDNRFFFHIGFKTFFMFEMALKFRSKINKFK